MTQKAGNMIRRIFKWIGIAILMLILLFVAAGFWTWKAKSDYELTAVPYLREVIPEIAEWDSEVLWNHYSSDTRNGTSRESHDKIVRIMSRLGELKVMDDPEFSEVTSSAATSTGARTIVTYVVQAKFENGDATITARLLDDDGVLSIHGLNVNSMALYEEKAAEPTDVPVKTD